MAFRFLHLADLHLETRFGGRPATRERLRGATLEAFARAVDFALDRRLDAVLVAGDLFDDPILSLHTELELVRQVKRLAEARVWFLYVCGNHDPGLAGNRAASLGIAPEEGAGGDADWRARVRVFRSVRPEHVVVTNREGTPVGVVVGAGHPTADLQQNLAERFPEPRALGSDPSLYRDRLPVVGLLHTQIESARSSAEHARYAPSLRADYERLDYDYWALGHVHLRQQAVEDLPVWYAGNLQGRNPREAGAKGGLVVELEPGEPAAPEFVPFAPVRWERLRVEDLAGLDSLEALASRLVEEAQALERGGDELALRLVLAGTAPPENVARALREAEPRAQLEEELARQLGALEVQVRTEGLRSPFDRDELRASPTVLAKALDLIERARTDDELLAALLPPALARDSRLEDDAARTAYARGLLEGLDEELLARLDAGAPGPAGDNGGDG